MLKAVDTHAHLDFTEFDADRVALLAELAEAQIAVLNPATDQASVKNIDALTRANPLVWGAVGLHPTEITDQTLMALPTLIAEWGQLIDGNDKLVAVGEIGLDYHHAKENAAAQKAALRAMLTFANERHLPVIFHCRDAYGDLATLLSDYPGTRGVIHCFSGTLAQANQFLSLDLQLSFTGNVTYPKNGELRAVLAELPLEKIMIETDAPFLSPDPVRGARNDPRQVVRVAETIAGQKNIAVEAVLEQTTATAQNLFKIS